MELKYTCTYWANAIMKTDYSYDSLLNYAYLKDKSGLHMYTHYLKVGQMPEPACGLSVMI